MPGRRFALKKREKINQRMAMAINNHPPPNPDNPPLIRASELTQYSFCQRAWWLSAVKGLRSENQTILARGQQIHGRHGRRVRAASRWRRVGWFLLGSGGILFIMALIWLWSGSLHWP